ncbi:MAG TPA: hypothetical protein VK506_02495, partial [Conexibacter sp.]|nr:hypothetical protein [Conexibacter sp.]
MPTAILAVLAIVLVGPWLGERVFAPDDVRFWSNYVSEVHPEPVEQGRFLLALAAPLLLATLAATAVRRGPLPAWRGLDALVVAIQAAVVGFAVLCLLQQQRSLLGALYPPEETPILLGFFTTTTLIVAAGATAALVWAVGDARLRASLIRWTRETRARRIAAGCAAAGAIVVWLAHALYTERTIGAAD